MNIDTSDPRLERLRALHEEFSQYPGAAPPGYGYQERAQAAEPPNLNKMSRFPAGSAVMPFAGQGHSFDTGLMPNDAKGYSDLLGRRTEFMNLTRDLQGKEPMGTKYGGEIHNAPLPGTNWLPQQTNLAGRTTEQEHDYQNNMPLNALKRYGQKMPLI